MERIKVGVIFGGRSAEHEVSIASAKALIDSLDRRKYEPVPMGIDLNGWWHIDADPARMIESGGKVKALPGRPLKETLPTPSGRSLADRFACTGNGHSRVDVIFPLIHGTYGEDGTLQGLLEMAGLPYVGAGVLGSAVGMDKWCQKLVLSAADIPVVDFVAFRHADYVGHEEEIEKRILEKLHFPLFVKPSNSGSSKGISKVKTAEELRLAIVDALSYDRRIVVEQGLSARELETAVLGNDTPKASRVGEVLPLREWYDFEAKYSEGGMRLAVPADIDSSLEARIQELAIRAFTVTDTFGMARIDFFLDRETGRLCLNEINTIPGFTAMSVYSKLWAASGIPYGKLVDRLIELALERHQTKEPVFLREISHGNH